MKLISRYLSKAFVVFLVVHLAAGFAESGAGRISANLENYLSAGTQARRFWIGCAPISVRQEIAQVYAERGYQPVWMNENGLSDAGREFIKAAGKAGRHGLLPDDYYHGCLAEWHKRLASREPGRFIARNLAAMDIMLSHAFFKYADHLAHGKVDPLSVYSSEVIEYPEKNKAQKILGFLGEIKTPGDVRQALQALAPAGDGYKAATAQAARLQKRMASGAQVRMAAGEVLRKDDKSPTVLQLRQILAAEGDLKKVEKSSLSPFFDAGLKKALMRFQKRHGLVPDGVAGRQTIATLNRPLHDRMQTIRANLERRRWLPRKPARRRIVINSAGFELNAWKNQDRVLKMRVISGTKTEMTPLLTKNMARLAINPYWNVPPGVLKKKVLPKIRNNPDYFAENHFEVLSGWQANDTRVSPEAINWSNVYIRNFPGRLRQKPGPWNALGRIKFIFPNRFSIYLHDTPEQHLFQRRVRAFSSGCIRVEKPVELALFILRNNPLWDRKRIEETIERGETTAVRVHDRIAVHLVYRTFWVSPRGVVNYRDDVYELDKALQKALDAQ
ncbi:MAG: L,D-transpeptidase family protein [Desulfosalsimonas sp.]|uniref:L,D-transpeptidase family protein n=1 Tax=Desulfosalsimonas sp. TaxID=3073848 RepID=UPI0039707390